MTSYSFNSTKPIDGSVLISGPGGGTINSTGTEGLYGNISSSNNRKPYVSGGAFVLNKNQITPALANGTRGAKTFTNYLAFTTGVPVFASAVISRDVNKVLADTNPSRPIVDLPVSIAELRDIPHLLKSAKDLFRRAVPPEQKAASGFLSWEFGIKPMLSDLKGVLDFQAQVDRRAAHLSRMYKNGGSRHRSDNGSGTTHSVVGAGTFEGAQVLYDRTCWTKAWIVVCWKPDSDLQGSIPPLNEIHRKAFRSVFGLNVSVSTVWEALPWSWLIDWFSSVGDYLQASRNSVGFIPGRCYQMVHSQAVSTQWVNGAFPPVPPANLQVGPSILTMSRKERSIVTASPISVSVPFLSARQLGILGSLAILRLK